MSTKKLSLVTIVLFVISLLVFYNENKRNTDLAKGSDFIKGLDISKIEQIKITFHQENNKIVHLVKDDNFFSLSSHKSFPTSTTKVNDLIYRIANILVKEKVKSNITPEKLSSFELDKQKRIYTIEIFDNSDTKTVEMYVGKQNQNKGNYIYKNESKDVYLSMNPITFNSSPEGLTEKTLIKLNSEKVEQFFILDPVAPKSFLREKNKTFKLADNLKLEIDKDVVNFFLNHFDEIEMKSFFLPTDPEVNSLKFNKNYKIKMSDQITYDFLLAKTANKAFLKLSSSSDGTPQQVVLNQNDSKERVKEIENMMTAQTRSQQFNRKKGRWIYEIDLEKYESITKKQNFILNE